MASHDGGGNAWWAGWWTVLILACLLLFGAVMGFWPEGLSWRIAGAVCIGAATLLWSAREVALDKQRETGRQMAQRAANEAREQAVNAAREAMMGKDPREFFRTSCREAAALFGDRKVRVGVYVLEPSSIDENTQDETFSLVLYGYHGAVRGASSRGMSRTVDPDDEKGANRKMVERALAGIPLAVPDVTKRCVNWDPVEGNAEQRQKYMSFISIPIELWNEEPTRPSRMRAGLLCVDCRDTASQGGLSQADEDLVASIALVMSIGFNVLQGGHRVAIPSRRTASRTSSGAGANVRFSRGNNLGGPRT